MSTSSKAYNSLSMAYSFPVLCTAFLMGPMSIIQGIYAKYFGMALTSIAVVLLISRVFDAVTDPIIGYLSDRHHALTGSRKPFMIWGGILFIICSYFLFVPVSPDELEETTTVSSTYFLGWFLAFYLAFTLFDIPHITWGSQLAVTSEQKNTIYAWRTAAASLGMILFYALPLLPIFESKNFTPKILQWEVIIAGLLMMPALYFSLRGVPDTQSEIHSDDPMPSVNLNFKELINILFHNKPLLLFLAAFFLFGSGIGMWFSMLYIFVDGYLELGEYFALFSLLALISSLFSLKIWHKLASCYGKQTTWCLSIILASAGLLVTSMLTPGENSLLPLLLIMVLMYGGFAAAGILAPSLLSDIIDYSNWKFRVDCSASHFALYTMALKGNAAIGGALGLAIAGWYDFDPSAINYSPDSLFGLHLAISWLPAPIMILSIVPIFLIPISARRHATILRCLKRRIERVQGSDNLNNSAGIGKDANDLIHPSG